MARRSIVKEVADIPFFLTFSVTNVLKACFLEFGKQKGLWFRVALIPFIFWLSARVGGLFIEPYLSYQAFLWSSPSFLVLLLLLFFGVALSFIALGAALMVIGSRLILREEKRLSFDVGFWIAWTKTFFLTLVIGIPFWILGLPLFVALVAFQVLPFLFNFPLVFQVDGIFIFMVGGILHLLYLYLLGRVNFYPQAIVMERPHPLLFSWVLTKGYVWRLYVGYSFFLVALLFFDSIPYFLLKLSGLWSILPLWSLCSVQILRSLFKAFWEVFLVIYSVVFFRALMGLRSENAEAIVDPSV